MELELALTYQSSSSRDLKLEREAMLSCSLLLLSSSPIVVLLLVVVVFRAVVAAQEETPSSPSLSASPCIHRTPLLVWVVLGSILEATAGEETVSKAEGMDRERKETEED